MKFLVAGLGNIGPDYIGTRHNIGFSILDSMVDLSGNAWQDRRLAFVSQVKYKARTLVLVKPTTYVNLSGRAVHYWLKKEKLGTDRLLIVLDDIALPFGTLRLRARGGDGGHNGLLSINEVLGTSDYARLRFGIGNEFLAGRQVDHVLGKWTADEKEGMQNLIERSHEIIFSFATLGVERTMNRYN